jgi:glycosyltransferase involved in cell wall biosynthesis
MRFHLLGIPHTISTPEYSACAFTQKVTKLATMLINEGHEVIHYGHPESNVDCTEHVNVVGDTALELSYPGHDWRAQSFPKFSKTDLCYRQFYENAPGEIARRAIPGDFLLCSFGSWHQPVAEATARIPGLIVVEPGIGYPNGFFAPHKVFESYALYHAWKGVHAALRPANDFWYDAVIPNAFRKEEFGFEYSKSDYLLFLGRVNSGKGVHLAKQIAEKTTQRLIIAGSGDIEQNSGLVEYVGNVAPSQRRALLANAKATICASTYMEPFCGVQIESMLSGTPVISTDWGAFAEYNLHGETGYRCKTFEQFCWAANNVQNLDPYRCRRWGTNFTLEAIAPRYTEYFRMIHDLKTGGGFYAEYPARTGLNHTTNASPNLPVS